MRPRTLLGLLIPLACAALFVRLGVWQLTRHRERAAWNAALEARQAASPAPFRSLPLTDSSAVRGRRALADGRFRYEREQVLAGRVNEGSPGVHLLTPLALDGTDTLLVVVRGWVYSPDAAAVELARWREGDRVIVAGHLLPLPPDGPRPPADAARPLRSLSVAALEARFGAPVWPVQLVMTSDSAPRADSVPRRLRPPALDAGPHWSYMLQWFGFAGVAVVGGALLFRRQRRTDAQATRSRRV
ncbi:MAG: SURF1 family protein [Gemmatimonadota bacterium]|nr:SURF1 family protein [Gemmatimonadota bacterium]MDQ8147869.1 SURF1 family protein [Gemmatimonadota bacterium]MDQ8157580.1 SURF1 family protein [Gemmatimonadota bacterium]MDQ8177331.1 SURF1 family protein [Gemmatimonadota bacterium]